MKRAILAGVVAALALGVVARAEIIEQVLVKVNGEIFTKSDLENRQVQALRQRGQQIDANADLSKLTDADLRKALDEVTPQIVVDAVDEMLIVQRGRELGYKLGDDQFASAIESIKKDNKHRHGRAVPGRAQAGGPDDGRPAAQLRAHDDHPARRAGRSIRARSASPRTRRACTTTRTRANSPRRHP